MTGDYPQTPAEVIVCGSNGADDTMILQLDQFLKKEDLADKSLLAHAIAAKQWLADNGVFPTVAVSQSTAKSKVRKKHKTVESGQTAGKPKKKMRTASDVIKRIQWQKELNPEDFTVGYLDRFLGVQEKEFESFSWDDIATVDDFAVLAIPKHRIQYFKYCGTVVWDKPSRLDNVFGSTGSGITLSSFIADSNVSVVQNPSGQQAEVDACVPDRDEESSDAENSDDEDDGFVVTIASPVKKESVPSSAAKLECPVMPPLPQRQQKRQRPNYFVCHRMNNPAIVAGVKEVQSKIVKMMPAFSNCFVDPTSLHMTLCTLALENESQVVAACSILQQAKSKLSALAGSGIDIHVSRVDHFYDRVLIACVDQSPALKDYAGAVRFLLADFIADSFDFKPHLTILKLTRSNDRLVGSNKVPRWLYSEFKNKDFGRQPVSTIDLCAMSHHIERPEGEFYVTPLHMDIL